MKKLILDIAFALTHPYYWISLYKKDKELDKWFNEEMERGTKFKRVYYYNGKVDEFYAEFAGKELWIKNLPYSCFEVNSRMPKRRTVYKLIKLLRESFLENE